MLKITDSQIHDFYPNTPARPWPEGAVSPHGPECSIETIRTTLDKAGVHRVILVPPSWTGWDNEYSLAAARKEPDRFGVFGRFNPQAPDAKDVLKNWRKQQGMLGVRIFFQGEPWMTMLTDPAYAWYWQIVEETQLPMMGAIPGNIKAFEPILAKHPKLRLTIDHAGRHPRGELDEGAWKDADQLYALAKYENVAVKVSSLPCFTTQPYPFKNLHPHIRKIYDVFGPQRMLWGSDVTRLTSTYEENLKLFTEALDFLSESDKEWILSRAASRACDWPL